MKSKIQMQVAKHMLAVWTDVNDSDSLKNSFDTITRSWPGLSRRTLRMWVKELHKNPTRYEFTGYAYKKLYLLDHFSDEESGNILTVVNKLAKEPSDVEYIIRSIIHHKWVYGMSTEQSIHHGIQSYYGTSISKKFRPAKPKLKGKK